jgi:hypothetical protein
MKKSFSKSQSVRILIVTAVILIGVIGYFVWQNSTKKSSDSSAKVTAPATQRDCTKEADKDICRFLNGWKQDGKYRMITTNQSGYKSVYEVDGKKSHIVTSVSSSTNTPGYDVILIDNTVYTKAGSVWYRQSRNDTQQPVGVNPNQSAGENQTDVRYKNTYKSAGKEACGNLTCFKYEVLDSAGKEHQGWTWFDDQDYKLRRNEAKDSVQLFEYDNVVITAPSPVKDLAANQYIVPGQTEPQTVPTAPDQKKKL